MLHLLPANWLPGMGCQRLLPGREWHWGSRHFCLCYDRTAGHRGRRRFHVVRGTGMRSKYAVGGRRDYRSSVHRRRCDLPCVDGHCRPGNRLSAGEGLLRNSRHRPRNVSVRIRDIVDHGRFINNGGVIDVGHRHGADGGVADVDAVDVSATHRVRRHIYFSGA